MKTTYLLLKVSRFGDLVDVAATFETRKQANEAKAAKSGPRSSYRWEAVGRPFYANGASAPNRNQEILDCMPL